MKESSDRRAGINLSRLWRWWPFFIAIILLCIGLVLRHPLLEQMAIIALVAITVLYVIFTHEQVEASKRMAEEMRESRFASFQPIIVMGRSPASVEPPDKSIVAEQTTIERRTYLYNVGPGPALNLRFFLKEPSRKNPSGTFSGPELRALGAGEVYELDLLNTFGQMRWSSHDLTVEYEDIFGRKWCSGLELNYTSGADRFTVINLFYEKMS